MRKELGIFALLVVLCIVVAILNPRFLAGANLQNMARFIGSDETKGFGSAAGFETLRNLATGSLFHIPMPFVLLIIVGAVMWVVLHRSVYGRYLFAVGSNEAAAHYSGINSRAVIASA